MSDVGKLERSTPAAAESPEVAEQQGIPGSALSDRGQVGGELAFRASGGRGGVAPMQRLIDERRSTGADLSRRIQRKADGAAGGGGDVEIPSGGGSALSSQMRQRFEPKLGADLSDVRVHTGGKSSQAAAGIGARAFTVGSDVHFNEGEFSPGSKDGDKLIAHELTHVVQGKKTGVQRKAEEGAEAKEGGGAEVSHPDEPAEKEADAVGDKVADGLHDKKDAKGKSGAGKGKEKEKGGGADHDAKDGEAGGDHEHGVAEDATKEKPAQISAKFIGVARKIMRAKGDAPGAKPDVKPSLKIEAKTDAKADPPAPSAAARDPGAWAAYEANWAGQFLPKLKENGIADATVAGLGAKKSAWFDDAYNACETGKDYQPIVDRIYAEIPKEPPGQEKHFWSGGGPAQGMADKAIADKGKAPAGGGGGGGAAGGAGGAGAAPMKAMRLETSHVGILFNGVFNSPPSKLDWAKQAIKFWQRASTNFAKATTGTVTAHLNIDFKYAKDQKVNRGAIFGQFEVGQIVENMKARSPDGKSTVVSALVLDMWVHGATKDAKGKDKDIDKKLSFTVGANPGVSEAQILDSIDAQIQVAVNT